MVSVENRSHPPRGLATVANQSLQAVVGGRRLTGSGFGGHFTQTACTLYGVIMRVKSSPCQRGLGYFSASPFIITIKLIGRIRCRCGLKKIFPARSGGVRSSVATSPKAPAAQHLQPASSNQILLSTENHSSMPSKCQARRQACAKQA